jgi:hypothetical protein
MVDQNMKRRPLDGNARLLEPNTQLSENIVNEALIARVVYKPVHNVAVRMRGDGIDVWRRVHIVLLSSGSTYDTMSRPRSAASTATTAICLRARLFGGLPRVRHEGTQRQRRALPFNP